MANNSINPSVELTTVAYGGESNIRWLIKLQAKSIMRYAIAKTATTTVNINKDTMNVVKAFLCSLSDDYKTTKSLKFKSYGCVCIICIPKSADGLELSSDDSSGGGDGRLMCIVLR